MILIDIEFSEDNEKTFTSLLDLRLRNNAVPLRTNEPRFNIVFIKTQCDQILQ